MVGLPTVESRESILRTLLSKEKVEEGLNYQELAMMTEGYSGSDLKVTVSSIADFWILRNLTKEQTMTAEPMHNSSLQTGQRAAPERTAKRVGELY